MADRLAPRRTMAVMMIDLWESTSTAGELGVARDDYFRLFKQFVDEQALEFALKAPGWEGGEGCRIAFASAADAIVCACRIQHRLADYSQQPDRIARIAARIGLSIGDDLLDPGDASGDRPTVLAARLCKTAEPGQIVCCSLTRAIGGQSQRDFTFNELEPQELKSLGLTDRYEVGLDAGDDVALDSFPSTLINESDPTFVGRDMELDLLGEQWVECRDEATPALFLIEGEAGAGKTRLAAEAAQRAHRLGSQVLHGRCEQYQQRAYGPFVQMLRTYFAAAQYLTDDPATDAVLARYLSREQRSVKGWSESKPIESAYETAALFDAMLLWLRQSARTLPLVVIIDDLGWADRGTVDLLRHIVANMDDHRVQILVTCRTTDVDRSEYFASFLTEAERSPHMRRRIDLHGLEQQNVIDLVSQRADIEPLDLVDVDAFAERLIDLTEGIAYYVWDTIDWLAQTDSLMTAASGDWPRQSGNLIDVSSGVRSLAEERLVHVPADQRGLIRLGALIGDRFDTEVLASAADTPAVQVVEALDAACACGLLRDDPRELPGYRFAHGLTRDALRESITSSRRALLHQRIAESIEIVHATNLAPQAALLSHHKVNAGGPENTRAAVPYLVLAAERALRDASPGTAVDHMALAIEIGQKLSFDDGDLARLYFVLGLAQKRSGLPSASESFFEAGERAERAGAFGLLVETALANSRGLFASAGAVDRRRVEQLEMALSRVSDGQAEERAALLANLGQELTFDADPTVALDMSAEALEAARDVGDPITLLRALSARNSVLWSPRHLSQRRDILREWEQVAAGAGELGWQASAHSFGFQAALESGSADDADEALDALVGLSGRLRQGPLDAFVRLWSGVRATLRGDLADATRLAIETRELNAAMQSPDADAWWLGQIYPIRWHQGRLEDIHDDFAVSLQFFPGLPVLSAALANIKLETGDRDGAADVLTQVPLDLLVSEGGHMDQLVSVACLMRVAHGLEDVTLAQMLLPLLEPYSDQHIFNGTAHFGSTWHYLALGHDALGDTASADTMFGRAEQANERLRSGPLTARTRQRWAGLLAEGAAENRQRAFGLATRALSAAEQHEWAGIARDATGVLAKL